MKKLLTLIAASTLLFAGTEAFAQNLSPSGIQFGAYGAYDQAVGSMFEHVTGNVKGGLDIFYQLPVNLPEFIPFSDFGISAGADFGVPVYKQSYIDSWYAINAGAGVWFDWNLFSVFRIRPEVRYGAAINIVDAPSRNVHGPYADQLIQLGATLVWEPVFMRGFSVYGGANYNLLPEQDNLGSYVDIKAGVLYRPENTYRKQQAAKKKAEEAAAIEAQKQAALIAEREKQEALERQRLEAEQRAREAQEKADAEELARLQAEKEALEAQLKAAEEARLAAEEEARIAAEKAAAEQAEAERLAAEEAARLEAEAKAKTVKKVEIQMNEDGSVAIAIPTLAFKSDSSELTDAKKNEETLAQVYEILTNPDYAEFKCLITGYVNPDNTIWTEAENDLALRRAQTVVQNLTEKGIDSERFTSAYGSGKTTNKEYNRRVEFKLTK